MPRRRRRHTIAGGAARVAPRDGCSGRAHPRRPAVRRRCRRGRTWRSARNAASFPERPLQGPHQRLHHSGQSGHGAHRHRRRRLQALSRHLQGAWWPQLRRVRPGEPDVRHGRHDRPARPHHGACKPQDDLQRLGHRRRHVDQLDPQHRLDGLRPAIGVSGRTGTAGSDLPRSDSKVGRGGERGALDPQRRSGGGHREDRRPAGRPYRTRPTTSSASPRQRSALTAFSQGSRPPRPTRTFR